MAVRERIQAEYADLTAGQVKVAHAVLADYPFSGLHSIEDLAARTGVSPPTVSRFVARIGFAGYQEFQRALIAELREGDRSPVAIRAASDVDIEGDFLAQYADRSAGLLRRMGETMASDELRAVAELCADPTRRIFVRGGRVSDCLARYLSLHLQRVRPGVRHLPDESQLWPHVLLQVRRRDVVILFDFRRYQASLDRLARAIQTARRGATIVLVTDSWQSPIASRSDRVVPLPIDIGTAWDSIAAPLAFVEALMTLVTERDWPGVQHRMQTWDALDATLNTETIEKDESDGA